MDAHTFLKDMSAQDFARFGMEDVAYIRPSIVHDAKAFVLMSAAGQELMVAHNAETAALAALRNGLTPLALH